MERLGNGAVQETQITSGLQKNILEKGNKDPVAKMVKMGTSVVQGAPNTKDGSRIKDASLKKDSTVVSDQKNVDTDQSNTNVVRTDADTKENRTDGQGKKGRAGFASIFFNFSTSDELSLLLDAKIRKIWSFATIFSGNVTGDNILAFTNAQCRNSCRVCSDVTKSDFRVSKV